MNPVALLTPTYGRDLEICTLLCESVDRHVNSFSKHYLLVPDSDVALFAPLASERRVVIPASTFLPGWLRPLPRVVQRKRRQFWWSLRAKPVSGWHVQQFLKIAATISLPHERYCILDSDIVFFRDFDLARFEYPNSIPLLTMSDEVTAGPAAAFALARDQPSTARPADAAVPGGRLHRPHHLLGQADDARAHLAHRGRHRRRVDRGAVPHPRILRIHAVRLFRAERPGIVAAAHRGPGHPLRQLLGRPDAQQERTERSCSARADKSDVAFSIASFSGTPVDTIRAAIAESDAILAPAATDEPMGLAALC